MLSRVAERIFWMARYVERAENTARLISVNGHLLLDLPKNVTLGWQPIIAILGLGASLPDSYDEGNERSTVRFLISDTSNSSSILNSLLTARENARTIRDVIPDEAWEQLNALYLEAKSQVNMGLSRRNRYKYLNMIILGCQQISGLLSGTMNHDEGYEFLRLGRNLERADMTTRIIDVRSVGLISEWPDTLAPFRNIEWVSILKSLWAYQMYRRKMQQPVRRSAVLQFLLKEEIFPRSVMHCVVQMQESLDRVPQGKGVVQHVKRLRKFIDAIDVDHIENSELQELMDELQIKFASITDSIRQQYFLKYQEQALYKVASA